MHGPLDDRVGITLDILIGREARLCDGFTLGIIFLILVLPRSSERRTFKLIRIALESPGCPIEGRIECAIEGRIECPIEGRIECPIVCLIV